MPNRWIIYWCSSFISVKYRPCLWDALLEIKERFLERELHYTALIGLSLFSFLRSILSRRQTDSYRQILDFYRGKAQWEFLAVIANDSMTTFRKHTSVVPIWFRSKSIICNLIQEWQISGSQWLLILGSLNFTKRMEQWAKLSLDEECCCFF